MDDGAGGHERVSANDQSRSLSGWVASARWFGAEFLVVVTGVLVALSVQSWYEARQDQARELAYLRQLASDLRETERLMLNTDSASRLGEHSITMLARAYNAEFPVRDSVLKWVAGIGGVAYRLPITGTAEALVSSGDLGLIRSDSLRAAIPAYITRTKGLTELYSRATERWYQLRIDLRSVIEPFDAAALARAPRRSQDVRGNPQFDPRPEEIERVAFPIDTESFLRNRNAYGIVSEMNTARSLLWYIRSDMRQDAHRLAVLVERELAR